MNAIGDITGTYEASDGSVSLDAGGDINSASVNGELGAGIRALGKINTANVRTNGHLGVEAANAEGSAADTAISGTFYGKASAQFTGWGGLQLSSHENLLTSGYLTTFASGAISGDLKAGGDVFVETWADYDGSLEAGASGDDTNVDAVVITHGNLSGQITSSGSVSASALDDISASIDAEGGQVTLEAGGTLSSTVNGALGIDVLARRASSASLVTEQQGVSVVVVEDLDNVTATGETSVTAVAGSVITGGTFEAKGRKDANGVLEAAPTVQLSAADGAVQGATVKAEAGGVSVYANGAASIQASDVVARSITINARGEIGGAFDATDSISLATIGADGTPANINVDTVRTTDGGEGIVAFADGTISGTFTSGSTLVASAHGVISGTYEAAGGLSLSSLDKLDLSGATSTGGSVNLYAGSDEAASGEGDSSAHTIGGTVSAAQGAGLFAQGDVTSNVTADGSISITSVSGGVSGSVASTGDDVEIFSAKDITQAVTAADDVTIVSLGALSSARDGRCPGRIGRHFPSR